MTNQGALSLILAGFVGLLGTGLAVESAAGTSSTSSDDIESSVVKITVVASVPDYHAPWQREQPRTKGGSGAIIAGDRILTNAHVVDDHMLIEVQRAGSPRRYTAQVEHQCDPCDLAILKVIDPDFFKGTRALEIGELPRRHQRVEIYGFPVGGESLSITSGIVSRIEVDYYSQSLARLLFVQVDAAINSGNSGGPAISDGKIAGVAAESIKDAENVGYIVPAPVVLHFLEDVRDGRFDGFPELDVAVQTLENAALRERLGLADENGGVLVVDVGRSGSAANQIKPGDVILEIDDLPVLQNDAVDLGRGLLVESRFVAQRKQVGDLLEVKLLRERRIRTEQIKMRAPDLLIDLGGSDRKPSYLIYGGLVFQPLTIRYLRLFNEPPNQLAAFLVDPTLSNRSILGREIARPPRSEVVVLTGILASELTRGYEKFEDQVVYAINGVPVESLEHLAKLLDGSDTEFVEITMEQGGVIALRRDQVGSESSEILARYQVSADRSPDLTVPASPAE